MCEQQSTEQNYSRPRCHGDSGWDYYFIIMYFVLIKNVVHINILLERKIADPSLTVRRVQSEKEAQVYAGIKTVQCRVQPCEFVFAFAPSYSQHKVIFSHVLLKATLTLNMLEIKKNIHLREIFSLSRKMF